MIVHEQSAPVFPSRVVVLGAGGFVGSTIVRELERQRVSVLAITRREVDLTADAAAAALADRLAPTDAVVFVSAIAPAKNTTQLLTNLHMAQAACDAFDTVRPAHLVYISSDAVYADEANPVSERSATAPSTIHGAMHATRELMFRSRFGGPLAFLRPTLIYGARDPHSGYGPNRFRRQAMSGEAISLFGEGEEKRDHIAVEDVARLAVLLLAHRSRGALNAVTGVATSFRDIADLVAGRFDPPARVVSAPRPGPRPHLLHRFFDITNLHKAFPSFHPEPLASGIARVHSECLQPTA